MTLIKIRTLKGLCLFAMRLYIEGGVSDLFPLFSQLTGLGKAAHGKVAALATQPK